jgi:hypothetical protein
MIVTQDSQPVLSLYTGLWGSAHAMQKFPSNLAWSAILGAPRNPHSLTAMRFPALVSLREISVSWAGWVNQIQVQLQPFIEMANQFAEIEALYDRLEEAGWLPHHTTPWQLLGNAVLCGDELSAALDTYYRDDWLTVKARFVEAINGYAIDEEAKTTFHEALSAHEVGLYRCVARTLFPEIERVSRAAIYGGAMDKMASQQKLQEAIGELYPCELAKDGLSGMRLYEKLLDHLYVSMQTPERVAAVAAEPVPNRHAAVHGHVSYNTSRNSVNALIIADFLFHAITAIVRSQSDCAEAERGAIAA